MPRIEQTILINAPIAHVYEVARDVEAFPEFMADLRSLKVLERSPDNTRTVTEWVGFIPAVKLSMRWTQEDVWNDDAYRDDFQDDYGRPETHGRLLAVYGSGRADAL